MSEHAGLRTAGQGHTNSHVHTNTHMHTKIDCTDCSLKSFLLFFVHYFLSFSSEVKCHVLCSDVHFPLDGLGDWCPSQASYHPVSSLLHTVTSTFLSLVFWMSHLSLADLSLSVSFPMYADRQCKPMKFHAVVSVGVLTFVRKKISSRCRPTLSTHTNPLVWLLLFLWCKSFLGLRN